VTRLLTLDNDREIWQLHLRGVSQRAMAGQYKTTRTAIARSIRRSTTTLAREFAEDLEAARSEILGQHQAVISEAWRRLLQTPTTSQASVGYLQTIVQSAVAQAKVLGLETYKVDHRHLVLSTFMASLDQPQRQITEIPNDD
jgi:IS30 family transposase